MRAILIGASGLTGSILLQQLLKDPVFSSVKIITRRSLGIQHAKLEEAVIDFTDEAAFRRAVVQTDTLFCCVGTTQKKVKGDQAAYRKIDFDIPVRAARYSAEQNVSSYLLVSAVGANAASSNFYLRLKGETEAAVLSQSISMVYILRPSVLLGKRIEARPAEAIGKAVMQFFSFFLVGSISKYKAIEAEKLAGAMVAASKKTTVGKFICEYKEMMELLDGN